MLRVVCTRLSPGHLGIPVGDSTRPSEKMTTVPELRLSVSVVVVAAAAAVASTAAAAVVVVVVVVVEQK